MSSDRGDERYLEVMLEEKVGRLSAPDLRHRVLAAPAGQRETLARSAETARRLPERTALVAAAVLLLGLVVTIAVSLFNREEPGRAPAEGESEERESRWQDPKLFRPKSKAEFLRRLKDVTSLSIEAITTKKHSHTFRRGGKTQPLIVNGVKLETLLARFGEGLQPALPAGWIWPNRIRFEMKGGRYMLGSMYTLGKPPLFAVSGIGNWAMTPKLAAALRPLVTGAETDARMREGVVFTRSDLKERPGGIPSDVEQLSCYALVDADLELLARFRSVRILDLRGCSRTLDGAGMKHVAKLSTLRRVLLNNTAIDDAALAQLGSLPELGQLDLRYATKITGVGFRAFQQTGALERLDLSHARGLSDEGLAAIAEVESLAHLKLSGRRLGRITAEGMHVLGKAAGLESIDLSDCALDIDTALPGLGNLRRLEFLDLSDTNVSADGLIAFHFIHDPTTPASRHPLRAVHLARCKRIGDKALDVLSRYGKLKELELSGCVAITADGVVHLTKSMQLKRASLQQVKLDAEACKHLATLPLLEQLNLGFAGIDDACLARLKGSGSVTELHLAGNHHITDVGLAHLASMQQLVRLDLNACDGFTQAGVDRLEAALPRCEVSWPSRFRK